MDNRDKMPRFDPREVLFLTNQWDSIDNADLSSEEDGDVKNIKEDQQTRKDIQKQLEDGWCCFDVDNVFRVSSKQVSSIFSSVTISTFHLFTYNLNLMFI